jgi:cytochrome b6-f complex iron-sulfur subunit
MDRKEFIKTCGFACLGTSALSTFLQSCISSNYYASHSLLENKLVIKKSAFTKEDKNQTTLRTYVLVKSESLNFPICVFYFSENNYSAVLMECTHKSCELHNQGNFLVCPCHGSEFTNKGVVQNPPAEQNLKSYIITTDHEYIYVHL